VEIYGPAVGQPGVKGKVARVYPAGFTKVSSLGVEQQRVMVVVRFDATDLKRLLDERRLGVGYRVRVRIITAEKSDALVVPRSALFRATSGDWQVFVVRGGRARLQKVAIGLMNDELAEITDGVADDEPVVLAPESTLSDGARVRVKTEESGRRRAEGGGQKVE
jgi:HlyD family secretion protein